MANPITAFFGLAYLVYRISWREIVPKAEGLWEDHKGKIFTALAVLSLANPITAFFGLAYLVYRINWREIVPKVEGWWRDIRDKVQRAISALNPIRVTIEIVKTLKEVTHSARDIGSNALDIVSSAISGALDIGSKARDIGSNALDIVSSAISGALDIGSNILPWHGAGGIAMAPHLAVVGDVPEAIIPLDRLASIMGGGARGMEIHIHGDIYGFEDFASRVNEALVQSDRQGIERAF